MSDNKQKLDANNDNALDLGNYDQFMPALTILEKIKETRLKFRQESVTVL